MRIAILVKQVPKFEAMELGPGGRLVREGLELELNPYCRRAVSKGAELAKITEASDVDRRGEEDVRQSSRDPREPCGVRKLGFVCKSAG